MKKLLSLILAMALLCGGLPAAQAAAARSPNEAANALYTLGLFQGTGTNADGTPVYALSDGLTRAEALTMLVRLLGRESEAKAGTYATPFTDLSWEAPYVGWAYTNGLTTGVEPNAFGGEEPASANMYLTFVLRALGYRDSAGDFRFENAASFAYQVGLTGNVYGSAAFLRGDAAQVSCAALALPRKGESDTLLQTLVRGGVVQSDAVEKAGMSSALSAGTPPVQPTPQPAPDGGKTPQTQEKTAEEIYAACSPAVFYIEVSDVSRRPLSTGSGFFITAGGTAVTNYHVIEGGAYATITLADGKTTYEVEGVLDYSKEKDLALLKVKGSGFPYLQTGDASTVVGGAKVYAIGSPLGLNNSISEGIISNVSRVINGLEFIQITASISSGSSGGALLNSKGQVIGVTTATIKDGQSLNLARPITAVSSLSATGSVKPLAQVSGASSAAGSSGSEGGQKGYADYGIPDFGEMFHVSSFFTDHGAGGADDYLVAYSYPIETLPDTVGSQYGAALENAGYRYNDYFRSSDGYSILDFYNPKTNVHVDIGLIDLGSQTYFCVMLSEGS